MKGQKQTFIAAIVLIASLFFVSTVFADIGQGSGGWASGGGATTIVNAWSVCNKVTNYGGTLFVPTGSATEWSYFRSYAPSIALSSCTYRIYTNTLTPDGHYIGTYDYFRGGGVNGQSTQSGLNKACVMAGRPSSTGNYACAPDYNSYGYICGSYDKYGCTGYYYGVDGYYANSSHGGWGNYSYGQGYCENTGVEWVDCN